MSITVNHVSGVGVNGRYAVMRDGVKVANVYRHGRSRFIINSVHYHETLGVYGNINLARAAAAEINYPDAWQVYEIVCQRIEKQRRAWIEESMHGKLVELARDLAAGSNSAQHRAHEMVAEIEAFAKDRSETYDARLQRAQATKTYTTNEPVYPEPPRTAARTEGSHAALHQVGN